MTVVNRLREGDRWIPLAFLAGFLVVLGANIALVVLSLSSWSGLTTERSYAQGLAYNQALAAARAQEELGWQPELIVEGLETQIASVHFSLSDRDGWPVAAESVRLRFVRPTQSGLDVEIALARRGGSDFRGEVALPLPGVWDVYLLARKGEVKYHMTERVVLK